MVTACRAPDPAQVEEIRTSLIPPLPGPDDFAAFWNETAEVRAQVRSAIEAWTAVVASASTIEDELWAAARENRPPEGWSRIARIHALLTDLGKQCLTPEQAAINPITHCPYAQLELLRPKVGAA